MNDKDKPSLTNAETDTESGQEGVSVSEDKRKHNDALQKMLEMGLISEDDYKKKIK